MGYSTVYDLALLTGDGQSAINDASVYDAVVNLLREMDIIGYALNEDLCCQSPVNWYSHQEDMLEVSKAIPDVLFCLHGEGDENGDIWNQYFMNGRSQLCVAEIKIPPFDPDGWDEVVV